MIKEMMTPEDYNAFLAKALVREDDPLRIGIKRHTAIMTLVSEISKDDPAMVMAIGRLIDQLVGSAVVQHLEAAASDPMSIPGVIRLVRAHVEAKIRGERKIDLSAYFGKETR